MKTAERNVMSLQGHCILGRRTSIWTGILPSVCDSSETYISLILRSTYAHSFNNFFGKNC